MQSRHRSDQTESNPRERELRPGSPVAAPLRSYAHPVESPGLEVLARMHLQVAAYHPWERAPGGLRGPHAAKPTRCKQGPHWNGH